MHFSEVAPFSAAIGALLGAAATYLFGLRQEARKTYARLRTEAYIDFIRSVASLTIARRQEDREKEAEALASLVDAKVRVAIYGSPDAAARWLRSFVIMAP